MYSPACGHVTPARMSPLLFVYAISPAGNAVPPNVVTDVSAPVNETV